MIARSMSFLCVKRLAFSVQIIKRHSIRASVLGLLLLALSAIPYTLYPGEAVAAPGINQTINFQGRLLNSDGTTVTDGNHSVVFSLYTVSTGGASIWTETQLVTTASGLFRVALGSVSTLANVDFNQDNLYLGIKVGADAEMTPRLQFTAAPYAFMAETATNALTADAVDGLTFATGKTLTINNNLTFQGTDGTTFTFPSTSGDLLIGSGDPGEIAYWDGSDSQTSSESLFWDNANTSLGIGTNEPNYALDVQHSSVSLLRVLGTGSNDSAFTFATSETGHDAYFEFEENESLIFKLGKSPTNYFYIYDATNDADRIRIEANGTVTLSPGGTGDVAIGKYTASAKLDVEGTFRASGAVTLANYTTDGGILYTNSSGVVAQTAAGTSGQCLQSNAGGAPTWGTCGDTIAADSLDFTDLSDTLALDANTSIDLGAFTLSTSGTGGITFGHTGATTYAGSVTSAGLLTASNGFTLSSGALSLPANSVTNAMVSNTLTASILIGSGSTSDAVDLATAEVSGTLANTNLVNSGALTVTAGTGLEDGGSVALGDTITINLANTSVSADSYGSASAVSTYTVDAQGRLTAAGQTTIAIAASQINSGTLAINRGGTNSTATPTAGGLAYGTGSAYAFTAAGLSDQCLLSNAAAAPTWGACDPTNVITGTGTAGRLSFWDGTNSLTSDAGLVWDNTNKRLGINTMPTADLEVDGTSILYNDSDGDGLLVGTSDDTASTYALSVTSGASPFSILYAQADGKIGFGIDSSLTSQWTFAKIFNSAANETGLTLAVSQSAASANTLLGANIGAAVTATTGTQDTVIGLNSLALLSGNGVTVDKAYANLGTISVDNGVTSNWSYNYSAKTTFKTGSNPFIHQGLYIDTTIESGVTLAATTGIFIDDAINNGTLTNQIGINIGNLDAATNNTLLLIGQSSSVSGNYAIYSGSSYQSTLSGPLYITASQNGATQGESNQHLVLRTTNENIGAGPGIAFSTSSGTGNIGARIVFERSGSNSMGDLVFYTKPDTTAGDTTVEALRITDAGNVEINSPTVDWAFASNATDINDGAAWLEYNFNVATDDVGVLSIRRQGSTVGTGGGIDFYMDDSGSGNSPYAYFGSYIVDNTPDNEDGGLAFGTTDAGAVRQIQMRLDDEGRLAIGGVDDITHTAQFEVFSTNNPISDVGNSFNYTQILHNPNSSTGLSTGLGFSVTNTDHNIGAALIFVRTNGNSMGELQFYTKQTSGGGSDPSLAMTLDDAGFIHVNLDGGTATEAVCHDGNDANTTDVKLFDCSGNPNADYAEMYPMAAGITHGDVVSLGSQSIMTDDGQTIVQLVKSSAAYDSAAIGIVSDNYSDFSSTGYNIADNHNPMPVALNGRVPVKIASHSTAIQPGDYLTTSTQPGRAIRATGPGFMIGRALQAWDPTDQTDTIMVFVDNGYADPSGQVAGDITVDPTPDATLTSQTIQDLVVQGSLNVGGPAEFNGPAIFKAIATFFNTVIFKNNVTFEQSVSFNQDAAGTTRVEAGQKSVDVHFSTPYISQPIITASLSQTTITAEELVSLIHAEICTYGDTLAACQTKVSDYILHNGLSYIITNQTTEGFTIELSDSLLYDVTFSWNATQIVGSAQPTP